MLKKEVTYEDFNGNTTTDTLYFNLTQTELMQMETASGMSDRIKNIIANPNPVVVHDFLRDIVIAGFGEKSEDGKHFFKDEELSVKFTQSAAFNALFVELIEAPEKIGLFFEGMLPKKLIDLAKEEMKTLESLKPVPDEGS